MLTTRPPKPLCIWRNTEGSSKSVQHLPVILCNLAKCINVSQELAAIFLSTWRWMQQVPPKHCPSICHEDTNKNGGIAPPILNLGSRWRWVACSTWIWDWVGPKASLHAFEKKEMLFSCISAVERLLHGECQFQLTHLIWGFLAGNMKHIKTQVSQFMCKLKLKC
jgi:hypothetical protein